MQKLRRNLVVMMAAAGAPVPLLAQAQKYPSRPVKILSPVATGSGTDTLARYLAGELSKATNQQFLVENRPGAGGNIGMAAAERAAPDGYTVVLSGLGTQVINPHLYSNIGWDPKNFDPIILLAKLPFLVAVNPNSSINSLEELVAQSKAKPGTVNITATSTTSRLGNELLKKSTGAALYPVSYSATNAAIMDALSGRVAVVMETVSALLPHVNAGKLKALAVTTLKSSPLVPGIKSVVEQGYPAFGEFSGWTSMLAPKGTPPEAIAFLNAEVNKILSLPATKARFADLGSVIGSGTPKDLEAHVAAERERWGRIIKDAGMKVE